ncbi:MAG: MFS transporter [Bacillaceae bacterium]|nr:MFS transporter [Bacillaceae bacterium]
MIWLRKPYFPLFAGVGISSIGDFMYLIAINILVYQISESASLVALLWILGPLAGFTIKSWSGGIVDRRRKKQTMILMDILRGSFMLLLPFMPNVLLMYLLIFAAHTCSAFFGPASVAYIAKIVPDEKRRPFNGIFQAVTTGGIIVGPALAGILLLFLSPEIIIFFNACSFFISALLLAQLPEIEEKTAPTKQKNFFRTWKEDGQIIWQTAKDLKHFARFYITFQISLSIGMALDALEWIYSSDVLGLDETQYSYLVSSAGIGYVVGSIFASRISESIKNRTLAKTGLLFSTLGYIGFAHSPSYWVAIVSFLILGTGQAAGNAGLLTLFQKTIPHDRIGRFSSLWASIQSLLIILLTLIFGMWGDLHLSTAVPVPAWIMLISTLTLWWLASSVDETPNQPNQAASVHTN